MYGIKDNKNFAKIYGAYIALKFSVGGGKPGFSVVNVQLPDGIDGENFYVSGMLRKESGETSFRPYFGAWSDETGEIYPHISLEGGVMSATVPIGQRNTEYIVILTELPEVVEAEVI